MYLLFDFNRNKLTLVIIIVLILSLSFFYFTNTDLPFFKWISDLIYNIITPVLNLIHHLFQNIKNFFVTLFSIDEINQEIEVLRQKNSVLERQILFLENIDRENERLRSLLSFKEKVNYKMQGAEVIANSPSIWEKTITIDRGSKDGLKTRMPVITYQGDLVGRIDKLGTNSAQVRLITDHDFVVGGIIARADSREIGLVKGSGRNDKPNVMDNIAWNADLEIGDIILTSGLSNNFPPGLKIGRVIKIETDNYGLSQKANINLYISNITLEEVMVIQNFSNQKNDALNNQEMNKINSNGESGMNDSNSEKNKNVE